MIDVNKVVSGINYNGSPLELAGGGGLPTAYQQVEYIESTGYQGVMVYDQDVSVADTNLIVEIDMMGGEAQTDTTLGIIACIEASYATRYFGLTGDGATFTLGQGVTLANAVASNRTVITATLAANSITITDGENSVTRTGGTSSTLVGKIHFFSNYRLLNAGSFKLYGAKVYVAENLVADLIPCYRKFDNVIGLYNLAQHTFCQNIGSLPFVKGGDVNG